MRTNCKFLTLASVLAWGTAFNIVHAEEPVSTGPKLGFVLGIDGEFGGDDVATVSFTDGSTQDVEAGQGLTLATGGYFKPDEASPWSVRATVGYKFVTTEASNADIGIERIVAEMVAQYTWSTGFWVGFGGVHHSSIEFDADGFGPEVNFDDATGYTAEVGWKWFGVTWTDLEYEDEFGFEYDASSVGLSAYIFF